MTQSTKKERHGIKDRLKRAGCRGEIEDLLYEARGLEHASERTQRQWKRIARRRMEELE